jgi:hypothetical protein
MLHTTSARSAGQSSAFACKNSINHINCLMRETLQCNEYCKEQGNGSKSDLSNSVEIEPKGRVEFVGFEVLSGSYKCWYVQVHSAV